MVRYLLVSPIALMALSGLAGCSKGDGGVIASTPAVQDAKAPSTPGAFSTGRPLASTTSLQTASFKPASPVQAAHRDIVRKAELAVRVKNVEQAEKQADAIVTAEGGYVDSANSGDLAGDSPTLALTTRVPAPLFDQTVARFEALGIRLSKSVSSEDVTGNLIDLDARLKTLQAEESAYQKMLSLAKSVQSNIAIQSRLTEIRGDIESMAGQRKTLGSLATLSTITLNLSQNTAIAGPPKDPNWAQQAWGQSTTEFSGFLRTGASAAIWLAVFTPLWIPLTFLALTLTRQRRTSNQGSGGIGAIK